MNFINIPSLFNLWREAIHVGNLEYPNSGDVYYSMLDDFMRSSKEDIEFLLEQYKILIYDGNFDIICNHSGNLADPDPLYIFRTRKGSRIQFLPND